MAVEDEMRELQMQTTFAISSKKQKLGNERDWVCVCVCVFVCVRAFVG